MDIQTEKLNYEGLDFDRIELISMMKEYHEDLIQFAPCPAFQLLFAEMMNLKASERPLYVHNVWLEPEVLKEKGLVVPPNILIQTSAFGDRRPTLFVIKKFLPKKYQKAWENVNWTFNNEFKEEDVPFDPENSWRLPLAVNIQNALISKDISLQSIGNNNPDFSQPLYNGNIVNSEKQ